MIRIKGLLFQILDMDTWHSWIKNTGLLLPFNMFVYAIIILTYFNIW